MIRKNSMATRRKNLAKGTLGAALLMTLSACGTKPVQETRSVGERIVPAATRAVVGAPVRDPFTVSLSVENRGEFVAIHADIVNTAATAQTGHLAFIRNGVEQAPLRNFGPIAPGGRHRETIEMKAHTGEIVVRARVYTPDTPRDHAHIARFTEDHLRLFGQERTSKPPTIDGALNDWNDPPDIRVWPEKHQMIPPRADAPFDQSEFSGMVRLLWTDTHVYIGANVVDKTPRLNPHEGPYIWMGDSLEVYLGFDGPTDRNQLGSGYHQIAISPGNGGKDPSAWDYLKGAKIESAEIASQQTTNGYTIEAAIPLAHFDAIVRERTLLAFTAHLNDKTHDSSEGADRVLIWHGDRTNWQNPAQWGVAMILPDPATQPRSPGRVQLFGGETEFTPSETATKDPAFRTPLPVEHLQSAAHLPEGFVLDLPWRGTFNVSAGYGFETAGWTHQTISNASSANDFFALDIDTPIGVPIVAPAPARIVTSSERGDSYGNYIVLDHGGGITTIYAHLDSVRHIVDKGEPEIYVQRGEEIARSGTTGTRWPHLHFAVHQNARVSHSGADVGGLAVCPEPLGGYYGIRKGHTLTTE